MLSFAPMSPPPVRRLLQNAGRVGVVLLVALPLASCRPGADDSSGETEPSTPVSKNPRASDLWGEAGELWSPDGRLPDFSWAGYHAGEVPIPDVPVKVNVRDFGAVGDGVADDSQAFLDAIEAVSDGAILIPAGRYKLTEVLRIDKSNVVLRGESRDSTVLYFTKTLHEYFGRGAVGGPYGWSWGGGWIWVNGEPARGDSNPPVWDQGRRLTEVNGVSLRGETSVRVADPGAIEPGQLVRLTQTQPDGSLSLHLHDGHQLRGRCMVDRPEVQLVNWLLEVKRVEGDRIHFDRPLRADVRPEWRATVWSGEPPIEEVGIESLTIEFPVLPYQGHHNEPGQSAISLAEAYNSWVRDVAVVNFDNAIFLWYSRFCTVDGVVLAGRPGHYGINFGGAQDSLVTRFRIANESVHDVSTCNMGNGNVVSWGEGRSINFDHHRGAAYENLYSRVDAGTARRLWHSSGTPSGHYTAARATFWNISPRAPANRIPHWPSINVIGKVKMADRISALQVGAWVEKIKHLEPEDLHQAQLARRLGIPIPPPPDPPAPHPAESLEFEKAK